MYTALSPCAALPGWLTLCLPGFSLADTLDCGQAFRWERHGAACGDAFPGEGWDVWRGVAGGALRYAAQKGESLLLWGGEDSAPFWEHYLSLDVDYEAAKAALCGDETLRRAIAAAGGIRLLRQAPFETLITFLLSQNNNIPRIRSLVLRLCQARGEPLAAGVFDFPTPQALAAWDEPSLRALGCGYRAPYLLECARRVAGGELSLQALAALPDDEARAALMTLPGVGPKVADCVLLFGFSRDACCPRDVWIRRVLAQHYPHGLPEAARGHEGVAQQFLFHWARFSEEKLGKRL